VWRLRPALRARGRRRTLTRTRQRLPATYRTRWSRGAAGAGCWHEAASGCRCRQARARPTCPAQRVRRNGCSPRLQGPDNHQERLPISSGVRAGLSERVAGVQLCALFLFALGHLDGGSLPDPAPVRPSHTTAVGPLGNLAASL
jgi:hypothetical protein